MTEELSNKDKIKMRKALQETPEKAIKRLSEEHKKMQKGENLEPELKPWPPNKALHAEQAISPQMTCTLCGKPGSFVCRECANKSPVR